MPFMHVDARRKFHTKGRLDCERYSLHLHSLCMIIFFNSITLGIGHFQVPLGLCFKTRIGDQPLIWKLF